MNGVHGAGFLTYVGLEIGKWRRERRLTQSELADQAGLSLATLQRIEKNGPVKLADLFAIARPLGIEPQVLLDGATSAAGVRGAFDAGPSAGGGVVHSDQSDVG